VCIIFAFAEVLDKDYVVMLVYLIVVVLLFFLLDTLQLCLTNKASADGKSKLENL